MNWTSSSEKKVITFDNHMDQYLLDFFVGCGGDAVGQQHELLVPMPSPGGRE